MTSKMRTARRSRRRPRWKSCRTRKRPCPGVLTKSEEELASSVTSAAETAKVIGSLHQNCDWLLQNFDTRRTAQNDEIVGILMKDETSADMTALEKKGLDRESQD